MPALKLMSVSETIVVVELVILIGLAWKIHRDTSKELNIEIMFWEGTSVYKNALQN